MDKFLKKLLNEMHSLQRDKNARKILLAARPVRNPNSSFLTSHPFHSIKKCDRIITDEVKTRGGHRQKTLALMPKKPVNRLECVGEFTCNEAVDILMAMATMGGKLKEVQKRGEYPIKKIKIKPKKSGNRLERVGEFTCKEAVDVLMARGTKGEKLNETEKRSRKKGLRWKRERRYFQTRTVVPVV